jgi:membrane protease YdiL (CAAX protease family)
MQTYLKTKPVWIQLLIFLGMAAGILLVMSALGVVILSKITGIGLNEVKNMSNWNPDDPKYIFYLRGMLLVQFLGLFLIPSLLFAYLSDPSPAQYLRLREPNKKMFYLMALTAMIVAIPIVEFTGVLNQEMNLPGSVQKWMKSMEEDATMQIQFMLHKRSLSELIYNLVFISLFAGIGEELFFRGILQRQMIRLVKNPIIGILITATIFSAFHLQFFGFIPRLLLGIVLGCIYWYSGSILVAMLAHFFYDGFLICLAYWKPSMIQNPDSSFLSPGIMLPLAIASGILTILIIRQMKILSDTSYIEIYKNDKVNKEDDFTF